MLAALLLLATPAARAAQQPSGLERPRLILLVVVDQWRADYLERFADRFGPDGVARLRREGAYFANTHYPYAGTETAPGYATLATGATPDRHGIVANTWYDWAEQRQVHAVYDPHHRLLHGRLGQPVGEGAMGKHTCGAEAGKQGGKEAGAAQEGQPRPPGGVSPCALMSSTLGDELKLATAGRGKLFGVGIKDRSAILAAGKLADGAFWFDGRAGGFVSSTYYQDSLPGWLVEFNQAEVDAYGGRQWAGERVFATLPQPAEDAARYYRELLFTPFANELVVKLAERLVEQEALGADDATDLLAVAFSADDYVGHRYGPYSDEVADMVRHADALLARLLARLDARVGRGRYWVALSSDHGVAPTLAQARALGLSARKVELKELEARATAALASRWGEGQWVVNSTEGLVLNRVLLTERGVELAQAARLAGQALLEVPGVAGYVAEGAAVLPPGYEAAFHLSSFPGRTADVRWLLEPFALIEIYPGWTTHGSPYRYDTHVPLLLAGPAFRPGVYYESASPADLVPTLAVALGLTPPAAANGRVLVEALAGVAPARPTRRAR